MDYAVIMAGGTGKRLWPLSRRRRPKQVLRLLHGETLLGQCFKRLAPIFPSERIIVLTNQAYVDLVREELPALPVNNVIAEPLVRDTAGAIGLAATLLVQRDPEARMAVVTADQIIQPASILQQAIHDALAFIKQQPTALVTFGIKPTHASTQYGYVQCGELRRVDGCTLPIQSVLAFREKPDQSTAETYMARGDTFWNAGMFVWQAGRVLELLDQFLPDATLPLKAIGAAWGQPDWEDVLYRQFVELPKISIDFAIMEKAPEVHAIRLDCDWLDMGTLNALTDVVVADANGNTVAGGLGRLFDSRNNIVVTEKADHMIATIGLENMIVAHSDDVTLVCPIDQAGRLKELLEQLEQGGDEAYL
ncbi:mannose-1-phosphate guanylyltransferase [Planctomycetota bacterium]